MPNDDYLNEILVFLFCREFHTQPMDSHSFQKLYGVIKRSIRVYSRHLLSDFVCMPLHLRTCIVPL